MAVRNAWGFSLFCDDIRAEVAGKTSVMGIYQVDMLVQQDFPILLAKFGILVKYYEEPGAFTEDVVLKILLPGDNKDSPALQFDIPRQSIISAANPYKLEEDQDKVHSLTIPVLLSPVQIQKEGFVKVRATCGDVTTNLGSLMVRKLGDGEKLPGVA